MNKVRIYNTLHHTVDSYGNGEAYCLSHKGEGLDVFLQGDDATQFRAELDAGEAAGWPASAAPRPS